MLESRGQQSQGNSFQNGNNSNSGNFQNGNNQGYQSPFGNSSPMDISDDDLPF
jgi:single-strand DNA-binding protein